MRKGKSGKGKSKSMSLLGKIKSVYCCAGSFEVTKPLKIFFQSEQVTGALTFPEPHKNDLELACKYAKKSGFGKGHVNIVDEGYRKALEYLPEQMGLSVELDQLISSGIADTIMHQLGLAENVRAELIKLNIYPEGCFFKSHVDSPKQDAFGSLVVFLPSRYEGGHLIISHGDQKTEYAFDGKEYLNKISWVAFYNDCVHEITEVKQGYRLTLSYNLSYKEAVLPKEIFPNAEIVDCLLDLNEGTSYGYYCQHFYGNNALKDVDKNELRVLKGKDAQLWVAATHLKVKSIELRVIFRHENRYAQDESESIKFYETSPSNVATVRAGTVYDEGYQEDMNVYFNRQYGAVPMRQNVQWINEIHDESKYVYAIDGYYGNDYTMNESYCELVVLIVK